MGSKHTGRGQKGSRVFRREKEARGVVRGGGPSVGRTFEPGTRSGGGGGPGARGQLATGQGGTERIYIYIYICVPKPAARWAAKSRWFRV